MFAQSEPSTLGNLKGQQYKDSLGNDIRMCLSSTESTVMIVLTRDQPTQMPRTQLDHEWNDRLTQ